MRRHVYEFTSPLYIEIPKATISRTGTNYRVYWAFVGGAQCRRKAREILVEIDEETLCKCI